MIKLFEQFKNEQEIIDICKKYEIKNYTINDDGSIDVDGNVDLSNIHLNRIPLRFNKVSGNFYCHQNKLTTLVGCPKIVGGDFYCSENDLTSLEGSPKEVGGEFDCYNNKLTSLIGGPIFVGGSYYCSVNNLTTLDGSPERVDGYFSCDRNNITSLKGGPIIVGASFGLFECPISIIDSSIEIKGEIYIDDTNFDDRIKSLSQEKLKILFEHGVDYDIFDKNGSVNHKRLERMFKDFNI